MRNSNKRLIILCSVFLSAWLFTVTAYADGELYYKSAEAQSEVNILGSVPTASGVTEEMCEAEYWFDKTEKSGISSDEILISADEIKKLNREMLDAKGTNLNDLENFKESYDPGKLLDSLKNVTVPTRNIYADGVLVSDNKAYYGAIGKAIEDTGYTGNTRDNQYAVAVKRTTIIAMPTKDYIGYSAADTDNEIVSSALNVNEPFIVRQRAVVSGNAFYWGYSDNCSGWVASEDLALCENKEEWLDAWKTDIGGDDFLIVTGGTITLEPSYYNEYLSEVKLTFGTILKLVPEDKIPSAIGERGPWNNYVVYLPTRDENGKYVKRCAFISQHYEVSTGYLKATQEEILRVAFNNLGDRYGWGGMLDSMDCSLFTRNIYKCFGLVIPRNTTWQQLIPGRLIDFGEMTDEEKLEAMGKMPAGTMFYFPGHAMMYVGSAENMAYVISDTGSLSDSEGDFNVRTMYSIIINPLSVRRKNEKTWLTNMSKAVLPISEKNFALVSENIAGKNEPGPGPEPKPEPEPEPVPEPQPVTPSENDIVRVVPISGQSFSAKEDTLALDTFLGTIKDMFISFDNVDASGVKELKATCVKGAKITTKEAVESVDCDASVAKVKYKKDTKAAVITMKSSGTVTFNMTGGKRYEVKFTVETPKPQKNAVKSLISGTKGAVSLNALQLFGTTINSGKLEIAKDKLGNSKVEDNVLFLNTTEKNTVKVQYCYLNKKYKISIAVK